MSITSLQQLGATLAAPMLTFFNEKLIKEINAKEPIFFFSKGRILV